MAEKDNFFGLNPINNLKGQNHFSLKLHFLQYKANLSRKEQKNRKILSKRTFFGPIRDTLNHQDDQ